MLWKSPLLQLSLVICLTGCFANEVFAQDTAPAKKEAAVEKKAAAVEEQAVQETEENKYAKMSLKELGKDFTTKMRAYMKRYQQAPKADKAQIARTIPKVAMYQPRLIEMVNEDPGSEAGLEVIEWWYRRGRSNSGDVITRVILKNYSKLETMEKYVPYVYWHLPEKEAEEQLRMLVETNPFDSVKGAATYLLHEMLIERAEKLKGEEAAALLAEVNTFRQSIDEDYPKEVDSGGATYASLLDAKDFQVKLEIGKPVPDIVGTDLDGVDFKLSDYDGKVRVISFWGDW